MTLVAFSLYCMSWLLRCSISQKEISKLLADTRMRREEQQEQTDMPDPFKFVEQKIKAAELEKVRSNWQRKIEIAAVAAKKAR